MQGRIIGPRPSPYGIAAQQGIGIVLAPPVGSKCKGFALPMGPAAIGDAVNRKDVVLRIRAVWRPRRSVACMRNALQGCMPVVVGMGVRVLVGLVFFAGEPRVPVLFDGCFMFGYP